MLIVLLRYKIKRNPSHPAWSSCPRKDIRHSPVPMFHSRAVWSMEAVATFTEQCSGRGNRNEGEKNTRNARAIHGYWNGYHWLSSSINSILSSTLPQHEFLAYLATACKANCSSHHLALSHSTKHARRKKRVLKIVIKISSTMPTCSVLCARVFKSSKFPDATTSCAEVFIDFFLAGKKGKRRTLLQHVPEELSSSRQPRQPFRDGRCFRKKHDSVIWLCTSCWIPDTCFTWWYRSSSGLLQGKIVLCQDRFLLDSNFIRVPCEKNMWQWANGSPDGMMHNASRHLDSERFI